MTMDHKALGLTLDERVDYLAVVATIAAADVKLENTEKAKLRQLGEALELPEDKMRYVLDVAESAVGAVERHLEGLRKSDLRFALLTDCVLLACADGDFGEAERKEIHKIADQLGVSPEQFDAVVEFAETSREAHASEDVTEYRSRGEAIASRLAAVGVPLGAVGAASAIGISATSVSTGLGALALGMGIASGVGLVLGAGVGTFMGVRWLMNRKKSEPKE